MPQGVEIRITPVVVVRHDEIRREGPRDARIGIPPHRAVEEMLHAHAEMRGPQIREARDRGIRKAASRHHDGVPMFTGRVLEVQDTELCLEAVLA